MEKKNKSTKILILILLCVTLIAVCVTMWALFLRKPSETPSDESSKIILTPDYAPQDKEENAEPIPDDTSEKLDAPEGGGAVSLTYSNEVTIDLSDKAAALYFANPGKSTQDMVLQIAVQDTIILQSGTLSPGNQVKLLNLLEGTEDMLSPGGYEGKFIVLYYDLTSGEKSMVNTEIPVTINVVG